MGEQDERVEGSLTDGGSLPGGPREDRSFGAGREASEAEPADAPSEAEEDRPSVPGDSIGKVFEGQGEDPGATDDGAAEPGTEHSGYGNTPPR